VFIVKLSASSLAAGSCRYVNIIRDGSPYEAALDCPLLESEGRKEVRDPLYREDDGIWVWGNGYEGILWFKSPPMARREDSCKKCSWRYRRYLWSSGNTDARSARMPYPSPSINALTHSSTPARGKFFAAAAITPAARLYAQATSRSCSPQFSIAT
jgi:hypothetical protein